MVLGKFRVGVVGQLFDGGVKFFEKFSNALGPRFQLTAMAR
jgi:hypothetical protein